MSHFLLKPYADIMSLNKRNFTWSRFCFVKTRHRIYISIPVFKIPFQKQIYEHILKIKNTFEKIISCYIPPYNSCNNYCLQQNERREFKTGRGKTQIGGRGKYFLTTNTEMKQKYTKNYHTFKYSLCIRLVNSKFIGWNVVTLCCILYYDNKYSLDEV